MSQGIDQLDLIVGTHAHADHIGGFVRIFPEIQIREIWYNGQAHDTRTFERFIDLVLASEAEYHEPTRGEVREYGRLRLEVLHPEGSAADYTGHLHDKNIVMRAVYGNFAVMLTGDAEAEVEHELLETGVELKAQVLKMGHHGSRTSSSPAFVQAVKPNVAVYQAGRGNRYGHPHSEAIASVSHVGAQILGTDRYETIVVETDGQKYTIRAERIDLSTTRPEIDDQVKEPVSRCVDITTAGIGDLRMIIHEAERAEFMKTWESLVNVDSGTDDEEGLAQVEALLVEHLKTLGAEVEVRPAQPSAGNNIVGTLQGTGDRNIMLMIHYDTVFPPGTVEQRPFRTDSERAYGPGVADAKGGAAIILHSLKILNQLGFDGFGTLTVFFNPDEEKGSFGSRDMIRELASQQDYVLSYEPPETDVVTVATNGINYVFLKVKGVASHAGSAPEQGRNAITELAHQLLQLQDLGNPEKATTVNWIIVNGGERRNIIPAEASAEGDMRYSDLTEIDRVIADANRIIEKRLIPDTEVEFSLEQGRPPLPRNEATDNLAALAQKVYQDIGRNLDTVVMRFGTDAGYAYVPDSAKPAVLETLGIVGAAIHSPDEFAELESVAPRLYLTTRLIMELSAAE